VAEVRDDALLQAAQGGDKEALETLLSQYQPQVYRFGMKMCGDPEDAREILQETLFAAARSLGGFRRASSISTWLYAIARSFCIKRRRRSAFAPELVPLDGAARLTDREPADTAPDPEKRLADQELALVLESAIGSLEPTYREVLLLRDVEGLPAKDVAEVTGLSLAAVKSRLHRARMAVREKIASYLAEGTPELSTAGSGICPDVVGQLSRHLEGEIGPGACAEMERHVAACPRCHAACESLRQTLRLCGAAPSPEVPADLRDTIRRGIRGLLAEGRR
jgi:RNA polymerase sigma-70 factor (ECF subfamily)